MDQTERYGLRLLRTAQAQKELTHNEAVIAIDGLLHPAVESMITPAPPADPTPGQMWIVPAAATGAWAQHSDQIACWRANGWTFTVPSAGCMVWLKAQIAHAVFDGVRWRSGGFPTQGLEVDGKVVVRSRRPAIADPSGGTGIDANGRGTIVSILQAMRSHGLIETA